MRKFHMTTYGAEFPAGELRQGWPLHEENGLPEDATVTYHHGSKTIAIAVRRHVRWGLPAWMLTVESGTSLPRLAAGEFSAWLELLDSGASGCYFEP